jgi:hypothetical protein
MTSHYRLAIAKRILFHYFTVGSGDSLTSTCKLGGKQLLLVEKSNQQEGRCNSQGPNRGPTVHFNISATRPSSTQRSGNAILIQISSASHPTHPELNLLWVFLWPEPARRVRSDGSAPRKLPRWVDEARTQQGGTKPHHSGAYTMMETVRTLTPEACSCRSDESRRDAKAHERRPRKESPCGTVSVQSVWDDMNPAIQNSSAKGRYILYCGSWVSRAGSTTSRFFSF